MLVRLVMPGVLLSLCVVVHALVMTTMLRRLRRYAGPTVLRFWRDMGILILVALYMMSAHLAEIGIWAFYLTSQNLFPDFRTSFYFSAVTYTTVGYGDLVLPDQWRLFAAAEALTGILMCGWSTGVFFAIVSRVYAAQPAETTGVENVGRR
jgi:hypothetical protein